MGNRYPLQCTGFYMFVHHMHHMRNFLLPGSGILWICSYELTSTTNLLLSFSAACVIQLDFFSYSWRLNTWWRHCQYITSASLSACWYRYVSIKIAQALWVTILHAKSNIHNASSYYCSDSQSCRRVQDLVEGEGSEDDVVNTVFVMDSNKFPFYPAEMFHQASCFCDMLFSVEDMCPCSSEVLYWFGL